MKDELEEGYFDAQGTYIWNKGDGSEVKDSWLDSIDWVKVSTNNLDILRILIFLYQIYLKQISGGIL